MALQFCQNVIKLIIVSVSQQLPVPHRRSHAPFVPDVSADTSRKTPDLTGHASTYRSPVACRNKSCGQSPDLASLAGHAKSLMLPTAATSSAHGSATKVTRNVTTTGCRLSPGPNCSQTSLHVTSCFTLRRRCFTFLSASLPGECSAYQPRWRSPRAFPLLAPGPPSRRRV